jgi:hypothetical protein
MEWIINYTKSHECKIMNEQGECIWSFHPQDMDFFYKLPSPDESLTKEFVIEFYEKYDTNNVLNNWWKEDIKFSKWSNGRYTILGLREPYIYAMILLCRLYGEKYCSQFSKAWPPLACHVAMWGNKFKWGGVISKKLNLKIIQAQSPKPRNPPEFDMVSFLLDVLYAQNAFSRLYLSWNMLWEKRYKRFYSQICDFVIPRIYFLIFGHEYPRLSKQAKKILTCIGNW